MTAYAGWTNAQREKERDRILRAALDRARMDAARTGRSYNCATYDHDGRAGCRNHGSGCLCKCHDSPGTGAQQ